MTDARKQFPDSEVIVRLEDIRALKLCSAGCRTWINTHGFNWTTFIRDGYTAQQFMDTGDGLITQVVEQARRRVNGV